MHEQLLNRQMVTFFRLILYLRTSNSSVAYENDATILQSILDFMANRYMCNNIALKLLDLFVWVATLAAIAFL